MPAFIDIDLYLMFFNFYLSHIINVYHEEGGYYSSNVLLERLILGGYLGKSFALQLKMADRCFWPGFKWKIFSNNPSGVFQYVLIQGEFSSDRVLRYGDTVNRGAEFNINGMLVLNLF
jgi:hypothetical protein